jgi:catechol 2,3-dioxygenase-like lactoylglutathione lyase family enzyme
VSDVCNVKFQNKLQSGGKLIIDHVGLRVSDVEISKNFYTKCLAPLGIKVIAYEDDNIGFGKDSKAPFWIGPNKDYSRKIHIAFTANNRRQVDEFYTAAKAAGGIDNGPPGIRKRYHPTYYAAFILDPDGHNIEAVCRNPE